MKQNETHGLLIYGVNSCGKTSYLKAVGLAVILAQSGLYVPASSITFKPFTRIMTRIAGGDNMERSQSSFIVELEELLSVVKRTNENTLVLGDEICRGTEVDSANAIVHTTLQLLGKKTAFFVAATHLHDIADKFVAEDYIKVKHMRVDFDDEGNVIYDRKLCDGSGPSKYGLEIAKEMNFPPDFIEKAMKFRIQELQQKKSRYNSKKILVACENCKYKPMDKTSLPLDVHHINFQCNANEDGYHGTQHKDVLHNLVTVCKSCHMKIHADELTVNVQQGLKKNKIVFEKSHNQSCNAVEF